MKAERIIKNCKNLQINSYQMNQDLKLINDLSPEFKIMLDGILTSAALHIEENITSYDDEKEEWLKIFTEAIHQKNKQEQLNKYEYCCFLKDWLDYPVVEKN